MPTVDRSQSEADSWGQVKDLEEVPGGKSWSQVQDLPEHGQIREGVFRYWESTTSVFISGSFLGKPFHSGKEDMSVIISKARELLPVIESKERRVFDHAADFLFQLCDTEAPVNELTKVRVMPGVDESVDLHWETERFELVVSFEADGSVNYYGDDYYKNRIEGGVKPPADFIGCWMKVFCYDKI